MSRGHQRVASDIVMPLSSRMGYGRGLKQAATIMLQPAYTWNQRKLQQVSSGQQMAEKFDGPQINTSFVHSRSNSPDLDVNDRFTQRFRNSISHYST